MQKSKIFLALLCFCAVTALTCSSIVSAENTSFSDVDDTSWYAPAVNFLKNRGIVSGYADGSYHPSASVNRAEVAQMLFKTIDSLEKEIKILEARIETLESIEGVTVIDVEEESESEDSSSTAITVSEELESNIIETIRKVEIISEEISGVRKLNGEAQNTGNVNLENVKVEIRYYDDEGNLLQTDETTLTPSIIKPGETGNFTFVIPDIPYYSYQIEAIQ